MALDMPRFRLEIRASTNDIKYILIKSALQADRSLKLNSKLQRVRLNASCQIFAEALLAATTEVAKDTVAILNDPALSLSFTAKEHIVTKFLGKYASHLNVTYPVNLQLIKMHFLLAEANKDPRSLTDKFRLEDIQEAFDVSIRKFEHLVDSLNKGSLSAISVAGEQDASIWLRIFFELGRYLSTVKEQKKDFVNHFQVCIRFAEELRDELI